MSLLLGFKVCLADRTMSPEDKLKRASIFKKMALRDKLEASRKRQSLGVLREELSKNQDVRDQLENLVEEASSP